jgi:AraC-like DNA-binding protein
MHHISLPATAARPYSAPVRVDIRVSDKAYAPHRHDTYVFALTCSGYQCFDYCGETRISRPGELVVLHPDEKHDGRAATKTGFRYRGISIDPAVLQMALGGRALPFIAGGVTRDRRLIDVILPLLADMDTPLETGAFENAIANLASAMLAMTGAPETPSIVNRRAACEARAIILETPDRSVRMDELEALTGHNRWQLTRDFKALYGTSPYRFGQLRRLDRARDLVREQTPLADAAYATGFADQSHFTRDFKKAYGITPKTWQAALQ